MSNFYDKIYENEAFSIEQAILAEDLYFSSIDNVEGKFFIRILTPMMSSDSVSKRSSAGKTSTNYVTLAIPAYILLHFTGIKTTSIEIPTRVDLETGQVIPKYNKKVEVLSYNYDNINSVKIVNNKITRNTTNKFLIPKGTVFLVEFLGGEAEVDKTYIVGVSSYKVE